MTMMPRSFAGRLSLFFVTAVVGAQLVAFLFFTLETSRLDRTAIRLRLGEQVETLVRLIDVLPPDATARALTVYESARHHYEIDAESTIPADAIDPDTVGLADHMRERMGNAATEIRLALGEATPGSGHHAAGIGQPELLLLSAHLRDGRWLNAVFKVPHREPTWLRIGLYQIVASIVAILIVVGLSRRSIVRPLTGLARMAGRLGAGEPVDALPERGFAELRTLTAAFNAMQGRLRAFVADRTRMLAAIGHDLRTPIASLWIRAEMIEEEDLRVAMIATIRQMSEMVDATLAFAKTESAHREHRRVDLAELVRSVMEDHRTLGHDVTIEHVRPVLIDGDPVMLRRAIDNLVGTPSVTPAPSA